MLLQDRKGNVYFDHKHLKKFRNDAQVADTLAHEIAHILMGHLVLNHEEITDLTSEFVLTLNEKTIFRQRIKRNWKNLL